MLTLPELQRIAREMHALRPLVSFLREQDYDLDGIARLLSLADPPQTLLTHTALHSLVHGDELAGQPSVLGTLAQLFLLACPVDLRAYELLPEPVRQLCERYGLVAREAEHVRGRVSISELDSRYYLADRLFENRGDHDLALCETSGLVMPLHESSLRLLRFLDPPRGGSFLDVGTGCGVQAIATRADCSRSKAIDLAPRAVVMASINCALNGLEVECAPGDCFTFADGRRYDRIAFNAPWSIDYKSPALDARNSPTSNVARFVDRQLEQLLSAGGLCELWSIFPILQGDTSVQQVFERELQHPERFRVELHAVREGGFHVAPAAIRARKLPRGCYLLQDPADAGELLAFLERNRIQEVLPVLLRVRLRGAP
jgi:hypothetical protein